MRDYLLESDFSRLPDDAVALYHDETEEKAEELCYWPKELDGA
jgi:hypothetical protein